MWKLILIQIIIFKNKKNKKTSYTRKHFILIDLFLYKEPISFHNSGC